MALGPAEVAGRLAYIRYLHGLGIEQSRLSEPMSSAALLMFHDAVESFLLMAAEHLGAPDVREFEKYWDALGPGKIPGGVLLPVQQGMKRLNKQRVTLKHHGGHPSQTAIETVRNDTATFLTEATQLVFGLDYDAVSMSSVIPQKSVRELALKADAANASGDRVAAMMALIDAWEELTNPWPPTPAVDERSPLRFGPTIRRTLADREIAAYLYSDDGSRRYPRRNEDIGRQIAAVTEAVTALQEAARLTAIGVDYAEYLRFRSLMPHREEHGDGTLTYYAPNAYAPAEEHVTFCAQFVVTAALRLSAAESQLVEPPWVDATPGWVRPWETIKTVERRARA